MHGERSAEDLARDVAGWAPEPELTTGTTTAWAVGAFAALLDTAPAPGHGDVLPPLWHCFGFLDHPCSNELGADGHLAAGPLLPPLPQRRRMFAGARWELHEPMRVGETLQRHSALARYQVKAGRSGAMLLVTVRHEFRRDGALAAVEEQDFSYRSQAPGAARVPATAPAASAQPAAAQPASPRPAAGQPATAQPAAEHRPPSPEAITLDPDEALLFRFSALTYNAHRIHYDQPYATAVEGYPGLVVHGPLLALLLAEIPRRHRPDTPVRRFAFRLTRPAFAGRRLVADLATDQPADGGLALVGGAIGEPPSISATAWF